MDSDTSDMGDVMPLFYIGHHDSTRALPVTDQLVHHAHDCGVSVAYDSLSRYQANVCKSMTC